MEFVDPVTRQDHSNIEFPPDFLSQSRQPQMIAGNIIIQTVGSLFFFARVYSRVAITRAWRTEDYILTLAWLFCTGHSICQYGQIENGAGRHIIATSMENPQAPITLLKYVYAAQILLLPALALPKISICLTYLRIFYMDKRGRYMIQALIVFLVLLIVPFSIEVAFQCRPVHAFWTEGRSAAKCFKDLEGFLLSGILNVLADISLMAIVLPRILELQLHQRQKWALTGIVLLGWLAVIAGVVRMARVGAVIELPNIEPSWDLYDVSIWTSVEIYVSLFCASAPGTKPVVKKIVPKLLGSSYSSRTRTDRQASNCIELGLSSKWKRSATGSSRIQRRLSETVLTTADGPYTQVGGGVDARSLSRKSEERSVTATSEGENVQNGHIYKTSEVSIQIHAV